MAKAKTRLEEVKLSEVGYLGIQHFDGVTHDELKKELNFPYNIRTYKQMSYHSTINSALTLFDNIISRSRWSVIPPVDATEEEIKQCKIVESMMLDMEQTWPDFISDVLSMNTFGFSVHEKVYRKRLNEKGSIFNDGHIGWKKLPIRAQETISKFEFSDDGNDITGVVQNMSKVYDPSGRYANRIGTEIEIKRPKFLLFRAGNHRGDPFGKSPLRNAYLAWRFLTTLEEMEATGVSKDLVGLPVLYLPPQYMAEDADENQKNILSYYQNAMRNLQSNQQSAMILPMAYDPESKMPLFKLELLSVDGKKGYDITKIKEYYKNLILTSLFADVLVMGQTTTGSFALGAIKNSLSGAHAKNMLQSICEVLNSELIYQTYVLNGWNPERAGRFDVDNVDDTDLATLGKFIQQVASVGLIEVDREMLNLVRTAIGADAKPDDMPPDTETLTGNTSRAGDGMEEGKTGNGTSNQVAGQDNTAANLANN